jgi:hypothetical protein
MSFVHWRPARAGEARGNTRRSIYRADVLLFEQKKRAAADRVFVQNFEEDSRKWLECTVTALERNPDGLDRPTLEYQVRPVDGGALYEGGKWLSAARLHDKPRWRSAA